MTSVKITQKKALAILCKEMPRPDDPLEEVMVAIRTLTLLTRGDLAEVLLETGAKMVSYEGKIWLSGYADDGGDVNHYFGR